MYCSVSGQEYKKISACETAKETTNVKETRLNTLQMEYKMYNMRDDENIEEFFDRYSKLLVELQALRKSFSNYEISKKIMRMLPKAWQSKVDSLESSKNFRKLTYDEIRGILIAYEKNHIKRHEFLRETQEHGS